MNQKPSNNNSIKETSGSLLKSESLNLVQLNVKPCDGRFIDDEDSKTLIQVV